MSFELRDHLQHILTEAEYLVDTGQGLPPEAFLMDATLQPALRSACLILLVLLAGCSRPTPEGGASQTMSASNTAAASTSVRSTKVVRLCTVRNRRVVEVDAEVDSATGDTTIAGRPVAEALPATQPPYIGQTEWYRSGEPVEFQKRQWITEGYPAIRFQPTEAEYIGEYRGAPIFQEIKQFRSGKIYLLLSPSCMFQPFDSHGAREPVRG